ncbi:hypothetical protein [Streptomyces sp. NPDC058674]|uniref:hypothetical protein n=1 Tax=Streptomyces sp. NPDC058674 TaxID=3346592 RepID=UPI0036606A95
MTDSLPWARVRLVDPDLLGPDVEPRTCTSGCTSPAVLHFRAEYQVVGVDISPDAVTPRDLHDEVARGEVVTVDQRRDQYVCLEHAGMAAYAAAYAAAAGPLGAV